MFELGNIVDCFVCLCIQILFHSLEKGYLLVNLPWLIGSLGKSIVKEKAYRLIFIRYDCGGYNNICT